MEKLARTVLSKRNTYYYIISIKTLSRNIPHAEKLAASNTFVSLSLSLVIKALATSSQFRSGQHANNARDVVFEPCTTVAIAVPYTLIGGKKERKKGREGGKK